MASAQTVPFSPNRRRIAVAIVMFAVGGLTTGCEGFSNDEPPRGTVPGSAHPNIPEGLDSTMAAQLTERLESENFVFHFRPGDSVSVGQQEALHQWAVDYLDIDLPKKIDYYKFAFGEMRAAVGRWASGRGFPQDYALATIHSWHPHEAMHIYTYALCRNATVRLYDEGMAVAHEFDPLNGRWVSRWDLWSGNGGYIYAEKVREHRAAGRLHSIVEILESRAFDEARRNAAGYSRILYDQAGMFVSYLISTFGIDKMKQALCSVSQGDTRDKIMREFEEVFRISVQDAERAWLAYLDASM